VEDLGQHLKKLREDKGIGFKKVFEDLRIREEQIRLIEGNRLFELGPYGVVKALIYNYARYLEADLDEVMAELCVMLPERTKKEYRDRHHEKQKKILLSTNFLWTVGIVIFVVILGSILWHAYQRGWLKTPDLFKASAADTTVVTADEPETRKPDSLRLRMRLLSEGISETAQDRDEEPTGTTNSLRDSTDYLEVILGSSPVNVPIH
jgi:cytoskeletal protein RodZ